MMSTLLVVAGSGALEDVDRLRRSADGDGMEIRSYGDHAVAWPASSPWLSSEDDGQVLVVVDGRLHRPATGDESAAACLRRRYLERGSTFAQGVLGDFVTVVLDRRSRSLLVSRDPLGVRPWYRAGSGSRHVGSTDVAALFQLPWVSDDVDEDSALAYLAGLSESRGPTLYRAVTSLAAGTTWTLQGGRATSRAHFTWEIQPEPPISWEDAIDRCREVLAEAVRCRIQAFDGSACELSGGLDSSAVVGTAVRLGHPDILVGRLLFDGRSADEREFSTAVIDQWGLPSVSTLPTVLSVRDSAELMAKLHRPPPDPNFTMFTGLHREFASRGADGILTGLGGDDAFIDTGMENRMISAVQQRRMDILRPLVASTVRHPHSLWWSTLRPTVRSLLPRARRRPPDYIPPDVADRHGLTARFAEPPVRLSGVRSIDVRAAGLTSGQVAANLEGAAIVDDLAGIRRSHPFLDPRVITSTYGLDPWFPVRGGHYRALQAAAYADRIPDSVATRLTKAEFSEVAWPELLQPSVVARITTGPLVARRWLDPAAVDNVLRDARAGRSHAALPLARMSALDQWLRLLDR